MVQPKISVIVPVYKAEDYLSCCIDSLLAQTFQDYEILLIDDGSPDCSGKICDQYAEKDSRVKVIHKKNGGVSSARQCGLDNAMGEYVIHADPDDWVEASMLEELYFKAKEENADMVICDFYQEKKNKVMYEKQAPSALNSESVLRELFQQLHGSCCNKLIKRDCYSMYNVSFPVELSLCEDHYINAALLKHDIRVSYLPKAFYHYILDINPNSIVNRYTRQTYDYDVKLLNKFQLLLADTTCLGMATAYFSRLIVWRAFLAHLFTSSEFENRCYPYIRYVFCKRRNRIISCLIYISCIGYYKIAYNTYVLLKWLRNKREE